MGVSEEGAVLPGTPATTMTFPAGSAEATLGVATNGDGVAGADGRVTASISARSGYYVVEADAGGRPRA